MQVTSAQTRPPASRLDPDPSREPAHRPLQLGLVGAAIAVLYAPTVGWLFERWSMSVWQHAHGWLIPPVVAYFVHQELKTVRHLPKRSSAWGFVFLVPALALQVLDAGLHTQLLAAISLLIALPGLALLFLGLERTNAILFPLAFSVFMLPIPLSFTEEIHLRLREIVTVVTGWFMPRLGVPVFAEGTTLYFANATLLVSDACSGFSTLYASLAVACLAAHSASSLRQRVLVLVSAAPLAVGANVLRVILLCLVAVWYGTDLLETRLHPLSGILTFALAIPAIFWLGRPSART